MAISYSQLKKILVSSGLEVKKQGTQIVVGDRDSVPEAYRSFATTDEVLDWYNSAKSDKGAGTTMQDLSIDEAAQADILTLIAPTKKMNLEIKPYNLEELQAIAGEEREEDCLLYFAREGVGFAREGNTWIPI